jgi:hypothetical protein
VSSPTSYCQGRPAEAKFLTEDEKDWIIEELEREEQQKQGMQRISAIQDWPT